MNKIINMLSPGLSVGLQRGSSATSESCLAAPWCEKLEELWPKTWSAAASCSESLQPTWLRSLDSPHTRSAHIIHLLARCFLLPGCFSSATTQHDTTQHTTTVGPFLSVAASWHCISKWSRADLAPPYWSPPFHAAEVLLWRSSTVGAELMRAWDQTLWAEGRSSGSPCLVQHHRAAVSLANDGSTAAVTCSRGASLSSSVTRKCLTVRRVRGAREDDQDIIM